MLSFWRSIWYHRQINLAVLLGVVCAAAVLTGALLVGDSMRGSLRALTLDRLGRIDVALQSTGFFTPPQESVQPAILPPWKSVRPAILLPAAIEANERIVALELLGKPIDENTPEIILNEAAADRLGVKPGETVSLRLNSLQSIPPESSLGRRSDLILRARLPVRRIIPNTGDGRFSMKADQQAQPLGIVPLDWLQKRLDVPGKVNTVFFETENPETVSSPEQIAELRRSLTPSFGDLGITVQWKGDRAYVKSERMLFTKPQAEEIRRVFPDARPGLLYLTTSIKAVKNGREVPYSTVFTCNETEIVSQDIPDPPPKLSHGIVLNRWTADDLRVEIDDEIELTWFEPEDATKSRSQVFRLKKIVPMTGLGADPNLVPEVKGFTDEAAIADWDPPFPFDAKKIRAIDEDYWDKYKAAPKAFVSLDLGRQLWESRFGDVTTFILDDGRKITDKGKNELNASVFGMNFVPVKALGLAASAGATPFSVLFLSFSFFIIASALMLVLMLFRLSVEMKAKQIGIRLAVGWTSRQVARLLLVEGLFIATAGSLFGVGLGVLYARVMVYGLTTWWVGAVTTPFLTLHIAPLSLLLGFLGGIGMAGLTILWATRNIARVPVKTLLAGDFKVSRKVVEPEKSKKAKQDKMSFFGLIENRNPIAVILFSLVFTSSCSLLLAQGVLSFFFVGLSVLITGLAIISLYFDCYEHGKTPLISLFAFGNFNVVRNRGRSMLFVGLVASTVFLVLTISAFRLDPEGRETRAHSRGDGFFQFIAETAFPVYHDIDSSAGRDELAIQDEQKRYLTEHGVEVVSFRVHGGDNAGCLNLYQSASPRILGVPWKTLAERDDQRSHTGAFAFAKPNKRRKHTQASNWTLLNRPASVDPDGVPRVPVFLDANTAMYSLHLYGGLGDVYERVDPQGGRLRCEVVGLLQNSVLQGDILIGEENFQKLFPESGGYRFFLFDFNRRKSAQPTNIADEKAVKIYYDLLGDYGFQGETTADRLRKLFAVQNTYLSTFQSLGGIGLLLGVFGLAVIQARNVFERRRELALLQAVGFSKSRIMLLLLYESFSLLLKGLGLALLASLFALAPFLFGLANQQASPIAVVIQFVWLIGGMFLIGLVSNFTTAGGVLKIPVARDLAEER